MAEENQNQEKLTDLPIPVLQSTDEKPQRGKKLLRPGGRNIREV